MIPLWMTGLVALFIAGAVVARAFRARSPRGTRTPPLDPLTVVRERYAQGLIPKNEFDHIVENLVRTEDAGWRSDSEQTGPHPRGQRRVGPAIDHQRRRVGCDCGASRPSGRDG